MSFFQTCIRYGQRPVAQLHAFLADSGQFARLALWVFYLFNNSLAPRVYALGFMLAMTQPNKENTHEQDFDEECDDGGHSHHCPEPGGLRRNPR
jgi:hypothetical protein